METVSIATLFLQLHGSSVEIYCFEGTMDDVQFQLSAFNCKLQQTDCLFIFITAWLQNYVIHLIFFFLIIGCKIITVNKLDYQQENMMMKIKSNVFNHLIPEPIMIITIIIGVINLFDIIHFSFSFIYFSINLPSFYLLCFVVIPFVFLLFYLIFYTSFFLFLLLLVLLFS